MTTVCIYKVEHKLVKELSREEGEKLVEFIESGSHIYRVDEDYEDYGVRALRYYVPEEFEEELDENDLKENEPFVKLLMSLQGKDILIVWEE